MPTNPTNGSSQFTAPYDILPNILYTNPTNASQQFTGPYNIQTTQENIISTGTSNPTNAATSQFTGPYDLQTFQENIIDTGTSNPTNASSQFNGPFDLQTIQEDRIARGRLNPTFQTGPGAFNRPFDLQTTQENIISTGTSNPTNTVPSQFVAPFNIQTEQEDKIATGTLNLSIPANVPIYEIKTRVFSNNSTPTLNYQSTGEIIRSDFNLNTNVSLASATAKLLGAAANVVGSQMGIPQIAQIGQSFIGRFANNSLSSTYVTLPIQRLNAKVAAGVKYLDFRSVPPIKGNVDVNALTKDESYENPNSFTATNDAAALITSRRIDGTAAVTRGSWKAGIYAAASISPAGAYSVFNLDGASLTGYGWGDHDNPYANRKDFTAMSHVATRWKPGGTAKKGEFKDKKYSGEFVSTRNPLAMITAFRGDKVNVIDFGKRTLSGAYLWKPKSKSKLEKLADNISNKLNLTQDFIKFFFTGPDLYNGGKVKKEDDIIVFRAAITGLSDSYTANWSPINMIGRADPNYHYTGYSRDVSLSFDIYATDRDEVKPIYRKLNALAGYTAPTYNTKSIAMEGPWMRLTIGDLYRQQPVVLTSLSYTFAVDAPWEINIEDDDEMMQVPLKIGVQCSFNMVSDYLPRKGGRFYTLAKQFAPNSVPREGKDNWLSDTDSAPIFIEPIAETGKLEAGTPAGPDDAASNGIGADFFDQL
jgi:hypothetical protein